jgi:predicted nucleotide-binding protein
MRIDWENTQPTPELDDLSKGLVREIAEQFLKTGAGVPDHAKRVELGGHRHLLNGLIQRNFITNIGNKYYPAFAALYYLPPELRARCEEAAACVLKAYQALYKAYGAQSFSLVDISDQINRITSELRGAQTARLGMLFTRDFPNYFGSNFEYSHDAPIKAATVWDNILDFEDLQRAWEEEFVRRHSNSSNSASGLPTKGAETADATKKPETSPDKFRRVFVIHGRDERLRVGIFTFLHALGLDPLEWTKAMQLTGKASPYIGEILEAAFKHAQAAVVLLTPDDEARLRKDLVLPDDPPHEKMLTGQARPNVLFEAGMAFASHPNQTVLVQFGQIRPFSDIAGRHTVKMDNSALKRQELGLKLRTAGCSVDMEGTDWQTVGDLTPPTEDTTLLFPLGSHTPSDNAKPPAVESKLSKYRRVFIAPISRSTSDMEYTLEKVDEVGVSIRLTNGMLVRVPKSDYIESWDDAKEKPKLILTRKYFQGYFPGQENAEEYFLPR